MLADRIQTILQTVIQRVSPLMCADRLYGVIYDKDKSALSFPLIWEGGKIMVPENEYWQARPLDGNCWLPDCVIEGKEPVLFERDVATEAAQVGSRVWPEGNSVNSWLGVPMIVGEEVLGALVAENWKQRRAFGEDGKRFLGLAARQAAAALENVYLYERWLQEYQKNMETQKVTIMGEVAGEFVHRMNNLAGTIPIRVSLARATLNPKDPKAAAVLNQLEKIEADSQELLRAAQKIKESTALRAPEKVNVNDLLDAALQNALLLLPSIDGKVHIDKTLNPDLPEIEIERNELLDTFTNIIKNALDAMPEGGRLSLETLLGANRKYLEIVISDTGTGIRPENLPKIFDLFFTTKPGGMGFGLWKDKAFLKRIGGDIDVTSTVDQGTTFIIRIPDNE
jgi:two-component system, NtrC family, sensor kinase